MRESNIRKQSVKMVSVPASDIAEIKGMCQNLSNEVQRLTLVITGDDKYGQIGMIATQKKHDDYIENDKKLKNKLAGAMLVGGIVWSYILKVLFK